MQNYEERLLKDVDRVLYSPPEAKKRYGNRSLMLKHTLDSAMVDVLQTLIYDQVRKDCNGCRIDHPSQLQHPLCLFTTTDEWVDLYIDIALTQLDFSKVIAQWYPEICLHTLTGEETIQAYEFWKDIKQQHKNRDSVWIEMWSERVKGAWNHGYH